MGNRINADGIEISRHKSHTAACQPGYASKGEWRMARCTPVSFDLVVWALDNGATAADVRAAHELCRQGEHVNGVPEPRITSFYRAVTAEYPDRASPASPWEVSPLHVATDHLEMNLTESCADEVLLAIERLAAEHRLLLFDPQDGSVYPPPTPVAG